MQYVSLDLETTGRDGNKHQILEFAAVAEDSNDQQPLDKLRYFHAYVLHDEYKGEAVALAMNHELLMMLGNRESYCKKHKISPRTDYYVEGNPYYTHPSYLFFAFDAWLIGLYGETCKVQLAGKNVGSFDMPFLRQLHGYDADRFQHQFLDVGPLFVNMKIDAKIPNTGDCLVRAGLSGRVLTHKALDDARMVIELLRIWGTY